MLFTSTRQGTILIIVAGVSALMASLALTFLLRMRSDVQETESLMRKAQAHIMLVAACHYIQEASRIGYDTSATAYHQEAYGWIDIRDGAVGPKATAIPSSAIASGTPMPSYGIDDDSAFPQQSVRRLDLYMKTIPPYAISLNAAPNAIDPVSGGGVPWLVEPDPIPRVSNSFADFERGNRDPRQESIGLSWFRLLRCGAGPNPNLARYNAATFLVTCGAGGTRGFRSRDWSSMSAEERALFNDDRNILASLEADEVRLWYLVEWSPAVGGQITFNVVHHRTEIQDADRDRYLFNNYSQFPVNHRFYTHSQSKERNFGGTIRYVQRLMNEPPEW